MQHAVFNAWRPFNEPLEGCVNWMYLDTHNPPLVTTGMGNMIDSISMALSLPWRWSGSGALAKPAAITAEWNKVKADTKLSQQGAKAASYVTQLRLSQTALDKLITTRLLANADTLKDNPAFARFEAWPADAQLGLLSMAWAMGPSFASGFPKFSAACKSLDFTTAAAECQMNGSPPPARRNAATKLAFTLAADVVADDGDPALLHSPVPPA